jgi:hypothetical protein
MKKRIFLFITVFLCTGILYSQVQVKKQYQQKTQILRALKIISPNRGEKWEIGKEYTIRWESKGIFTPNLVKMFLTGSNTPIIITSQSGTSNDGVHNWRPKWDNPPPGHYKLQIMTLDGAVKDESDGSFEVIPPPVDLSCTFRTQIKREGGTHKKPFWYVTIMIHNKGTKKLKNVMFNWVITKNNVVIKQDGAGYGLMYPNKLYETDFRQLISPGTMRIEVFVDPENQQGENEYLRRDNTAAVETKRK